jgi:isopenicillin N synthase-like dioxygenase
MSKFSTTNHTRPVVHRRMNNNHHQHQHHRRSSSNQASSTASSSVSSSSHTILSLTKLINRDNQSLNQLISNLERKGWCYITLPDTLLKIASQCINETEKFFETDCDNKRMYSRPSSGYIQVPDRKQAFRMLTGTVANKMKVPSDNYLEYAKQIDTTVKQLIEAIAEPVFGGLESYKEQIPLIHENLGYGMLDVIRYDKRNDGRTIHVGSHGDPGLLSISLQSTAPGLQMYDPELDSYVDVPMNVGVLFCGLLAEEITNGRVKVGIHKVMDFVHGRMVCSIFTIIICFLIEYLLLQTMVYETCTMNQTSGAYTSISALAEAEKK